MIFINFDTKSFVFKFLDHFKIKKMRSLFNAYKLNELHSF